MYLRPPTIRPALAFLAASSIGAIIFLSGMSQSGVIAPPAVSVPYRQPLTSEQLEILSHLSLVYLDDGSGNLVNKTIRISGVNVQVVNGTGSTASANGVGNLLIGYNELGNPNGDDRTGSHTIVGGSASSYSSYGSLVIGWQNSARGAYSTVSGGSQSVASGLAASVSGGADNTASATASSVSGGLSNIASGQQAWVGGGGGNEAGATYSAASGGVDNEAGGLFSSAFGGDSNDVSGDYSTQCGGFQQSLASDNDWAGGDCAFCPQ